jgi:serine/threonine-protein kinase
MEGPLPRLGPKYRLERRRARTGMVEFFLAVHEGPAGFSRKVLVKTLLPSLSHEPQFVKLFLEGARVAAQFTHPNIAHTYDFGESEGTYFVVLENVEGKSLASLQRAAVKAGRQLTPGFVATVGSHVCAGLAYAHAQASLDGRPVGIAHRDINPTTIIACVDGAMRILDFGLAKAAGVGAYTEADAPQSAPGYLSPEQCMAVPVDPRSDLFSLGMVLWELVARRKLVGGTTQEEISRWICEVPAPRLRTIEPTCPEVLALAIERALEIDPERRFASAAEMGRVFESFLTQTGASANEETRSELLRAEIASGGDSADVDWLTGEIREVAEAAPPMEVAAAPSDVLELEPVPPQVSAPVVEVVAPPVRTVSQERSVARELRTDEQPRSRKRLLIVSAIVAVVALGGAFLAWHFSSGAPIESGTNLRIGSDPPGRDGPAR